MRSSMDSHSRCATVCLVEWKQDSEHKSLIMSRLQLVEYPLSKVLFSWKQNEFMLGEAHVMLFASIYYLGKELETE
jgi:hypothetical protein